MNSMKKLCAIILSLMLCVACVLPGVSAAPVSDTGITGVVDKNTKSIHVDLLFPNNAGEEVSFICYDPTYDPAYSGDSLIGPEESICYLNQYTLDSNGKASVEFPLYEVLDGDYTVAVGTKSGSYVRIISAQAVEIFTDKSSYGANETITITVNTPSDATKIRFYNEFGRGVSIVSTKVTESNGSKIWTVTLSVATPGEARSLTVKVYNKAAELIGEASSVPFAVVVPSPTATITTDVKKVKVNETFKVFITTDSSVNKIYFENETGRSIGKILVNKTVVGDQINWVYDVSLGTPGASRIINVDLVSRYGERVSGGSVRIDVIK